MKNGVKKKTQETANGAKDVLTNDQYLYGIVLSQAHMLVDVAGIQGRPVYTMPFGCVAALLGDLESTDRLGTPDDLEAHTFVLDSVARSGPVLPMSFGTVIPGDTAICSDVLEPNQDEYYEALTRLSGYKQYTLLVRYERDVVLHETLAHNPGAVWLREAIVGSSEKETRAQRVQLNEIVDETMENGKYAEAAPILEQLGNVSFQMCRRNARQADDVVEVAFLLRHDAVMRCTALIDELAQVSGDRLRFRLIGPQAPYDFVADM